MFHTPGPWTYNGSNSITADFENVGICILEPIEDFWSGDVNRHPEGEEYQANARLISAAPNLLAALIELLDAYEDGIRQCHCAESGHRALPLCTPCTARAAIAKVRGENR